MVLWLSQELLVWWTLKTKLIVNKTLLRISWKQWLMKRIWWEWGMFATQKHDTIFVVNYKSLTRREDVETNSPLHVGTKWILHICNNNWEFANTIETCFNDGVVHQEMFFWRFKITWLPCFDVAISTLSIMWSNYKALDGCDENF
jgi:hypothetical protein